MERRFLSDVAKQFRSLSTRGERIAVGSGFTRDFRDKRYSIFHKKGGLHNHFQGIGRAGNVLFITGSHPHGKARADLFAFRLGSRAADPGPWGSNLMRNRDPSDNDRLLCYHAIDSDFWHAGSFTLFDDTLIVPLEGTAAGSVITFLDVSDAAKPRRLIGHDIVRPRNKAGVAAVTPLPGGHVLLAIWTDSDPPGADLAPYHLDIYISDEPGSLEGFTLAGRYEPSEDHGLHRQFQGLDFLWENGTAGERLFLIGFENVSPVQPHPTDPGENRAYLFELALPDEWLDSPPVTIPFIDLSDDFATFISARIFETAGDWFNMDAGACAYVDSNQHLIVYAVHHFLTPMRGRKTGDRLGFKCVEFRATTFADVVDRIEDAWVELYEKRACSGRRLALLGPWDSSIENTKQCFVEDEPFERPVSVRYQIPEDRAFVLYPNERFEGAGAIVLRGDGRVHEIDLGSVAQLRPVRSCRFQPLSVAELLTGSTVV
jgi:hypothetical protein